MSGNFKSKFAQQVNKKREQKEKKKHLENMLKQALALSSDGQIAILRDGTSTYYMLREDKLQEALGNVQRGLGFTIAPSEELLEFHKYHQEVLTIMSKLDYEELGRDQFDSDEDHNLHKQIVERNAEMFNEFDAWTFDFSEGMAKSKAYRRSLIDKYVEFRKDWPVDEILNNTALETKVV